MLGHTFLCSQLFVGLERSSALWCNLKEGRNNFCTSWCQGKLPEGTEVGGWCSCALWSHWRWSILASAQDCGWWHWTYLPQDKHEPDWCVMSRSGTIDIHRYFLVFSKTFKASCCWGHDEADQKKLESSWLAYICPCTHTQPFRRHFTVWRESGHQPIYVGYCFIGGMFYVISTH